MFNLIIFCLLILLVIIGMPIYLAMGITSIIYIVSTDMTLMIVPRLWGVLLENLFF